MLAPVAPRLAAVSTMIWLAVSDLAATVRESYGVPTVKAPASTFNKASENCATSLAVLKSETLTAFAAADHLRKKRVVSSAW